MSDNATVDLAAVLDGITEWINRYTIFPTEHCCPTLALWAAHTWVSQAFDATPRLVLSSAVPGSGKTRVLELLNGVCHDAQYTPNISPAALYRSISKDNASGVAPLTLLFDEVDAIFSQKNSTQNEDLRGLLNSGYKKGAQVMRCDGPNLEVVRFTVFAPVALAGLVGNMPDTITTRAITIHMKKKAPGERVEPYRIREAREQIREVSQALETWSAGAVERLEAARPDLPRGVQDRSAEVWEPLVAIADEAGGHWPATARAACRSFVFDGNRREPTRPEELLFDIREIMGHGTDTSRAKVDRISTRDLLAELNKLEESGWSAYNNRDGMTPRELSRMLRHYDIRPVTYREANGFSRTAKGYVTYKNDKQDGFFEAWARYLPPAPSSECVTTETSVTPQVTGTESVTGSGSVTETPGHAVSAVPVTPSKEVTKNSASTSTVTDVPDVTDLAGIGEGERMVLDALSETPVGVGIVMKSVPKPLKATVPDVLQALEERGLVISQPDQGTYALADRKEDAA
ncbi:DUF3631 domain-containing protein [Corynebacterium sp. CCM 9185]|uniref:DUF3631 domain-containing protein n=1 Tax=Corynebacterium marambiense TaxID=2765364 RepID=A0ABS0VTE7_9CORY|nr:DUF3631 domain-containing protein [Corynebacterium marambiense]MCK7663395.1 DUF3631 domain-containing protein [Corynebacterium marambiense]